jgi:hypothetical protein
MEVENILSVTFVVGPTSTQIHVFMMDNGRQVMAKAHVAFGKVS